MPPQHFIAIVNPNGGTRQGLRILETVRPLFAAAKAELQVHVTTRSGHATELARTLDLNNCDGLCLIGGDGTLHEVVSGLMQRDHPAAIPLGIIPGGTGNSFAQHFDCLDPSHSARRILSGNAQPLDVLRVMAGSDTTHCVNVIGWGAIVDINRTAERLRTLGPSRYVVGALLHILRPQRRHAKLTLDGQIIEDDFLLAAACNTRFTGKGMQLAPQAESGDGQLDIVIVRSASRLQMLNVLRKVFDGSHLSMPCVEYHRVRSLRIEHDGNNGLNLDGELKGSTPLSVDILPAALRILA